VYPDDKDKERYQHPKGGEDAFTDEPNLPFPAFL
jgi:L-ascorbate 6-phosphate lactonase